MVTDNVTVLRLFQLISPSLPTGAFSYSQGLEWAVERGWVKNRETLKDWLNSILHNSFRELEIPLLRRMYEAVRHQDQTAFALWRDFLVASRETRELRLEEINRGRAMAAVLNALDPDLGEDWLDLARPCQAAGFAYAAAAWDIGCRKSVLGYTWSWLDNIVIAAIKLVPLGQTAGQTILTEMVDQCSAAVEYGMHCSDDDIGGGCPALAIASSLHETQYTRLFRS